jgi:hypothetical protein
MEGTITIKITDRKYRKQKHYDSPTRSYEYRILSLSASSAMPSLNNIPSDILRLVFETSPSSVVVWVWTTIEAEFMEVLKLLETILDKVDLGDEGLVEAFLSALEWNGADSSQRSLLGGLRSSVTSGATLRLLQRLFEAD